ncbi:putative methyltransferase tdiE-like protein [Cladobotryum mycophilum]|uniref:Methyltransferase tdiE-like protein n=1 Tax=Cladobotryum mycophilum TaxID=491253 RepID=A0ABR0S720_9HYPO
MTAAQKLSSPQENGAASATLDLKLEVDPDLAEVEAESLRITSKGEAAIAPDAVLGQGGRTYHGLSQGAYHLPNDADEQDRLGTGIWAIDFEPLVNGPWNRSKSNPAQVAGIQPFLCSAGRREGRLAVRPQVRLRAPAECRPMLRRYKARHEKALDQMNPDGWIEIMDAEGTMADIDGTMRGTALERFPPLLLESGRKVGRDVHKPANYKKWLREVGFVDVVHKTFQLPGNPWPKDPRMKRIGAYQLQNLTSLIDGLHGLFGATLAELIPEVKRNLQDTNIHFYNPM